MSKEQTQRARELRQTQTYYESILWRLLRDRRLEGYKFRRQHPIDRFVADFACINSKLIIELDGNSHDNRQERDEARDEHLKSQGWQTLRVRNTELMNNGNGVVLTVLHRL
jgi:adenine-specific DNA-methyltransferase